MRKLLLFCCIICLSISVVAQQMPFGDLAWRNIGPANQGGRIVDVEAQRDNFTNVWVATASGGVWHSKNAGTTWESKFDNYETASIGDIAIDPNNVNTIWVGTGEANNRNSTSWGNGIYKSTDEGDHFELKGLANTHAIARVLVHPTNSDDVCVCAVGHLWGYAGDRGLFQSTDGGDSWNKLTNGLPNDGKTGCTDIVRDPSNPAVLYTAFYHRLRQPWTFTSGGEQGGIYKSTDNGKSWSKLSRGLPTGGTGRIGLAIAESNPNIVMAIIEAKKTNSLDEPGSGIYRSEDGGESWKYINDYNNRPFYYSQIRINPANDQRVYLTTTRFMVSTDGGKTFQNGSEDQEVHGDFHAMWIDPSYPDRYYLGADKGFSLTHDHGAHFTLIDNLPIAQFYRISYDMRDPYYVYGGLQDNGSYATASFARDARGILSDHNWKMHWGDGQYSAANPYDHTDMYTSMESGSYFKYNPDTRQMKRIAPTAANTTNHWDYFDKNEADIESAIRFNWSAPMIMSSHDPSHIYVAGNHIYRSTDKGVSWTIISPDLSTNDPDRRKAGVSGGITPDNTGAETNASVFTLSVSPIDERIIWAGTDDGLVHCTLDGGKTWKNVTDMIPAPAGLFVSRIVASKFDPARAYVSMDGHRSDLFEPLIYVTDDNGSSWRKIINGLPNDEVVRVIIEDHESPNLLFIGTERGVFVTTDRGINWRSIRQNMPVVSVYDLKIHERDHDLIAGTHGRSLWIMDDIRVLREQANNDQLSFGMPEPSQTTLWNNISRGGQRGHFWFAGENPPSIKNTSSLPRAEFVSQSVITYFVSKDQGPLQMTISTWDNKKIVSLPVDGGVGIHRTSWDRTFDSPAYTPSQAMRAEEIWTEALAMSNATVLRRYYDNFKEAATPALKRAALERLTGGFINLNIPEDLVVPRAGVGSYKVTLSSPSNSITQILEIRADPMD